MNKKYINLEIENKILKQLLKHGFFVMHYFSEDPEGETTWKNIKYDSLEKYYSDVNTESKIRIFDGGFFSFELIEIKQPMSK